MPGEGVDMKVMHPVTEDLITHFHQVPRTPLLGIINYLFN